ncbi:MAG: type I restriction enzyme HsdR N-terminal domain-containing protein, partial [bacterium]|nr:type I restriction enzyme HsdR N-terminal domain-containing protein [bacterium]
MSDDADMERVRKEIEQIKRELGEQTPPNEATTCSWVVEPLLLVAGYRRMDWIQEVAGLQGNKYRPDYTVLAETPHCWLLEAKTWNHPLLEQDANQLTSYANVHNIRWAVLTNGKEWQLYD